MEPEADEPKHCIKEEESKLVLLYFWHRQRLSEILEVMQEEYVLKRLLALL